MATNVYQDLLRDIITEVNKLAQDESKADGSEFDRGYRAGMMVIMKAIQDETFAFDLPEALDLIDVDTWFRGESDS